MAEFRTTLVLSFFYKFFLSVLKEISPNLISADLVSATKKLFQVSFFVFIKKMIFLISHKYLLANKFMKYPKEELLLEILSLIYQVKN